MEEADRQYFEAMERLFAYPEMKIFLDDVRGWQDAISSQWRALKPEQLAFEQGRFNGLEQVANHASLCENMYSTAISAASVALLNEESL